MNKKATKHSARFVSYICTQIPKGQEIKKHQNKKQQISNNNNLKTWKEINVIYLITQIENTNDKNERYINPKKYTNYLQNAKLKLRSCII